MENDKRNNNKCANTICEMTTNFNYILLKMIELQTGKKSAFYIPTGDIVVENEDNTLSPITINEKGLKILPTPNNWILNFKKEDLIYSQNIDPEEHNENIIKTALQQIQNKQISNTKQSKIKFETEEKETQNSSQLELQLDNNITFLEINQVLKQATKKGYLRSSVKISESQFKEIKLEDRISAIEIPQADEETQIAIYQLSKFIVSLCFAGISTTQNPERITLIKDIYAKSIRDAQKLQIRKLKENVTTLSKIVNKNNAANKSRAIGQENEKIKLIRKSKRIKIIAFSLSLIFLGILTTAMIKSAFTGSPLPQKTENKYVQLDSLTISTSLKMYEQKNDTLISEWRKGMIIKVLKSKKVNVKNYDNQLDSLVRLAWKK